MLSLFGFGKKKIKEALKKGAVVIDVRTPHEFDQGKVPGSINIPAERIPASIERIKAMKKPVILCCTSGMRSAAVKNILIASGIPEVYNGGRWESVLKIYNNN
jgi:rhodanese-related sulfurtransferase